MKKEDTCVVTLIGDGDERKCYEYASVAESVNE